MTFTPSLTEDQFRRLAQDYDLIPLYGQIILDMATPVSTFLKLHLDQADYSFLLESVVKGEIRGRYSFIGHNPSAVLSVKDGHFSLSGEAPFEEQGETQDPLAELQRLLSRYGLVYPDPDLPNFSGGAVGYFAYDLAKYYETIPQSNSDPLALPDLFFQFTEEIILFDHIDHKIKIVVNTSVLDKEEQALHAVYHEALARIQKMMDRLNSGSWDSSETAAKYAVPTVTPEMNHEEFLTIVDKAKGYIREGDIFQGVLSNRFTFDHNLPPFQVYRAFRSINPSPYLFFYKFGDDHIVGSSPEILIRSQNNQVEIRPIAGTRPRGASVEQDQRLAEELLQDDKEIAEHIMLVDLARNDIGRIARKGTVRVDQFKTIERYSHVMHIVSSCVAELDTERYGVTDAVRVSLPAGTLSGAPKVRAMEIIEKLERVRRSFYGGALGYISFRGDMDLAILIRSMYLGENKGVFQAGAGVVHDSVPENEYQEVHNKTAVLIKALELAARGLEI